MVKRLRRGIHDYEASPVPYVSDDGTSYPDIADGAATTIAQLERDFKAGTDPGAPLQAIVVSYGCRRPAPNWALQALADAYIKGWKGDIKSWDDVFGRPNTKGQVARFNRDADAADKIWNLVAEAKARGESID
jgi:hypothetical protein